MEEVRNTSSPLFLNSFVIKIIAIVLMTIDHIGQALTSFAGFGSNDPFIMVLRAIGRISYPLFCFLIVQGALHTKRFSNYALKLGIVASAISLGMVLVEYLPLFEGFSIRNQGVVFVDLLLGATAVYCLKHKKILVKLLAVLPLAYSIASTFASGLDCVQCMREVWFVPFFMRTQYGFFGVVMMILIYLGHELANYILSTFNGAYDGTYTEKLIQNIAMAFGIVIACTIYYFWQVYQFDWFDLLSLSDPDFQLFAALSALIIVFYNSKPGFNKIWFRHGCYLYYIVHLIIIYGIFMIIYG